MVKDAELEEDEDPVAEGAAFEEDEGKVSGVEEGTVEGIAGAGPTEV